MFGLEQLQIQIRCVNVAEDSMIFDLTSIKDLLEIVDGCAGETELALGDDIMHGGRLVQSGNVLGASTCTGSWIDSTKAYVVTGGLGGLGLAAAHQMLTGNVMQMSTPNFHSVCLPKVDGVWNLHHALLTEDISHLLYYSSISALLGFSGQANNSFANGWLDGMSELRQG